MKARYTKNLLAAIDEAGRISASYGVSYVGSEQILYGLLKIGQGVAARLMTEFGVSIDEYLTLLIRSFQKTCPIEGFTERCTRMLDRTADIAERAGCTSIATEHVLLSILMERDCVAVSILKALGVDVEGLYSQTHRITFASATAGKDMGNVSVREHAETAFADEDMQGSEPSVKAEGKTKKTPENARKPAHLRAGFFINITVQ